jgi:hypothetical protein
MVKTVGLPVRLAVCVGAGVLTVERLSVIRRRRCYSAHEVTSQSQYIVRSVQRARSRMGNHAQCGGAVDGPLRQPVPLVIAADGACHVAARWGLTRRKKGGGRFHTADVRVTRRRGTLRVRDGSFLVL